MVRRAIATVVLAAVLGACSGGDGGSSPTTLPPTTRPPTPVEPTGVADTVRRWVRLLEAGTGNENAAFAMLGPGTQAAIGGRAGYPRARRELRRTWGVWGTTTGATFDGLPIDDGLSVVLVSVPDEETGLVSAAALPMRVRDNDWVVEPLLDTGQFRADPGDLAKIAPQPELRVEVDDDVRVTAYVDTQPAEVGDAVPAGSGRAVVTYRPSVGLRPGVHVVTLVFERGEAVTARVVRYEVALPD